MKFYRAIRYIHASNDGRKTLCGQTIARTPVNNWLWTEVDNLKSGLKPCPKCKKKMLFVSSKPAGRQTQLKHILSAEAKKLKIIYGDQAT